MLHSYASCAKYGHVIYNYVGQHIKKEENSKTKLEDGYKHIVSYEKNGEYIFEDLSPAGPQQIKNIERIVANPDQFVLRAYELWRTGQVEYIRKMFIQLKNIDSLGQSLEELKKRLPPSETNNVNELIKVYKGE